MSSPLILQQYSVYLVRLIWMVLVMGGRWPYSCCFVGCYLQDLFKQRLDDQLEPIYSGSLPIHGVSWKTCRKRWTIETGSERGSGKSMLPARHDDEVFWSEFGDPFLSQNPREFYLPHSLK